MIRQLGLNFLSQADFQYKNMWFFLFIDNPSILSGTEGLNQLADMFTSGALPVYLVKSINLPFHKLEIESKTSGRKVYQGIQREAEFPITFIEKEGFLIFSFLRNWMNKIYNPTTQVFKTGLLEKPTKLGILNFLSPKGLGDSTINPPVQTFVYEGIRITGIDDISLDYSSGEPLEITANFVCDRVYPMSEFLIGTDIARSVTSKLGL